MKIDKYPMNSATTCAGLSPSLSYGLCNQFNKRLIPFVSIGDNYYPRPEDKGAYEINCRYKAKGQTYPTHYLKPE